MQRLALHMLAATSIAGVTSSQAATWTVDDDGIADFADIQLAVQAASDGDTIVARAGTYGLVAIDAKGLNLVADGDVTIFGAGIFSPGQKSLSIRNLAPDQSVSMRGFTISGFTDYDVDNVEIDDNSGAVAFEHCVFDGSGRPFSVSNSESVTLANCLIQAPPTYVSIAGQFFLGIVSYNAISSSNSNLFLYDSEFIGSAGSPSGSGVFGGSADHPAGEGGNGVRVSGGSLLASGCTFTGGHGGIVAPNDCYPGVDGGAALIVSGIEAPGEVVQIIDCTFSAGFGSGGTCSNPNGETPAAIEDSAGAVQSIPGPARSFGVDSPVLEETTATLHIEGQPGDAVTLFFSVEYAPALLFDTIAVAAHIPLPALLFPVGTLPAGGTLDFPVVLPSLTAASLDSFTFVGQAIFLNGFDVRDGGPTSLTVVASGL